MTKVTFELDGKTFDLRAFEKALYEKSFYEFIKAAWQVIDPAPYKDNWHIEVIADHLQAVVAGEFQNLLNNVPPGCGKSLITNVFFPAWVWTTMPHKSFLSVAHKETLAIRDAVKMRRLVESDWYQSFWPTELMKDQNSKGDFANTRGGYRTCSPMANATGKRANFILVDDPHSVQEAKSDAYRKAAVDVFRGTLPTRLNDHNQDSIIVIMQRLHQEDVSGYILDNAGLGYAHLCIPYVADGEERAPTPIGWKDTRKEGELMWPEHVSQATVDKLKISLGPFGFAGQMQQNPVPASDGFFRAEWFKRYKPSDLPAHVHYYMTSDHAPAGKSTSDYNVFRVWAVDEFRNIYLVDSFRKKCLMNEAFGIQRAETGKLALLPTGALPFIQKYKPLGWFPENDLTWTNNKGLIEAAMLETGVFCAIKPLPTKGAGDKVGKAQAYQAMASAGLVFLPEGHIGDEAIAEYVTFPAGRYDDQIDADGAIARAIYDVQGGYVAPISVQDIIETDYAQNTIYSHSRDLAWG